jgi:exonuclease SbcD
VRFESLLADSDFARSLLARAGLHIAGAYQGGTPVTALRDRHGAVYVWQLPFLRPSTARHCFPDESIPDYDAAVAAALRGAPADPTARNVLLAHQFVVAGGSAPEPAGSESDPAVVGTLEQVSAERFDAFDYVALGHIHRPQRVGRDAVRYAGSPLKYSAAEALQGKSFPLVTLGEKGRVEVELLPIVPWRDVRRIQGPIERLLAPDAFLNVDDYLYVTLTDEDMAPDAMGRIRAVYPNALQLEYRNARTRSALQATAAIERKDVLQHFADLYGIVHGQPLAGEPLAAARRAAAEPREARP